MKLHKQRFAILILAATGMLSAFLPWLKITDNQIIYGTQGDGWIVFMLFAVPLVMSLTENKSNSLNKHMFYGAVIPSLIASIIGIYEIDNFNSTLSENEFITTAVKEVASIQYGLYLAVVVGIVLPVVAFLLNDKKNNFSN